MRIYLQASCFPAIFEFFYTIFFLLTELFGKQRRTLFVRHPVCMRWFFWLVLSANVFPQSSHLYGLTPLYKKRWLKVAVSSKCLPTVITSARFDSTMYEKMAFQIAFLNKYLPTVITSVRSDSTMYQKMTFQYAGFSKRLPTVITSVRFDSTM